MTAPALWTVPAVVGDDTLPSDCDDLVIGGGIVGLTTAVLLARAGRAVCVVEACGFGSGSTGRSSAKISLLQGVRYSSLLENHSLDAVRAYARANRDGFAWITEFCAEHAVVHERRAAATFAREPDEVPRARAEFVAAEALGLPVTWQDGLDVPFPVHGAAVLADQVQVDPGSLVESLAREARAAGAVLVDGARVAHVDLVGSPRVRLADGRRVRPRSVVVATNGTILDRSGAFADTEAQRSYIVAYRHRTPPSIMALSAGSPSISVRDAVAPDGTPVVLVGGHGHVVGRTRSEVAHVDALRAWAAEHLPEAEEIAAWSAQDRTTSDGLPRFGRLTVSPHVRHATGMAKWGFTNGPAAALAISGDILGDAPAWHARMERGRPVTATVRRRVTLNASVARELVSGWVRAVATGPSSPRPGRGAVHREGVLLVADADDGEREHRVSPVCTHLGGILRWNDLEQTWDCPLHGSRFSPDGEVLDGPATAPLGCPGRARDGSDLR